jgi:hypothetical protein
MDYEKLYKNLIESRKLLYEERELERKAGSYFEKHHIIPKCKGGSNFADNLVLLTAREHFIAHWILWLIYRDRQMALAFHKMISTNKFQKRNFSSRGYQAAREAFRLTNIGNTYGRGTKGRVISENQKKMISLRMKGLFVGEKNHFYGKKHTLESRLLISEKAKNRNPETFSNYKGDKIITKDNIVVAIFKRVADVAKFINCSQSNVKHVLAGNQKTVKGYVVYHECNFNLNQIL